MASAERQFKLKLNHQSTFGLKIVLGETMLGFLDGSALLFRKEKRGGCPAEHFLDVLPKETQKPVKPLK